ncbi:MAG TPA: DHHA1 domain-containing protein, partial [Candidatus Wallbacteria bacterium]|nr:DHHA1 domain-containing protein [Candidatus Wallbacteria bacterium]
GAASRLAYSGEIQRDSLRQMIERLGIEIRHTGYYETAADASIITVDGVAANHNINGLSGKIIAVVDHHETKAPPGLMYCDIKPRLGSCATLIFQYFEKLKVKIPSSAATALSIGIGIDTSSLTRGASPNDAKAYFKLMENADNEFVNYTLRNNIQKKDLEFFKHGIDAIKIEDEFAFCYFPEGCNQNLMGIIANFFLSLNEIRFVVLCAKNGSKISFSVRSEKRKWNAAEIIRETLDGIGFGGGHRDMAGGVIQDASLFDENRIIKKFVDILNAGR